MRPEILECQVGMCYMCRKEFLNSISFSQESSLKFDNWGLEKLRSSFMTKGGVEEEESPQRGAESFLAHHPAKHRYLTYVKS